MARIVFSQEVCIKPEFPKWDKETYTHIGTFVNSVEVKDFFVDFKEYMKCEQERKKLDTNGLRTQYAPSWSEFKKEINFDNISPKPLLLFPILFPILISRGYC